MDATPTASPAPEPTAQELAAKLDAWRAWARAYIYHQAAEKEVQRGHRQRYGTGGGFRGKWVDRSSASANWTRTMEKLTAARAALQTVGEQPPT